jgi:hypothetical protein
MTVTDVRGERARGRGGEVIAELEKSIPSIIHHHVTLSDEGAFDRRIWVHTSNVSLHWSTPTMGKRLNHSNLLKITQYVSGTTLFGFGDLIRTVTFECLSRSSRIMSQFQVLPQQPFFI